MSLEYDRHKILNLALILFEVVYIGQETFDFLVSPRDDIYWFEYFYALSLTAASDLQWMPCTVLALVVEKAMRVSIPDVRFYLHTKVVVSLNYITNDL